MSSVWKLKENLKILFHRSHLSGKWVLVGFAILIMVNLTILTFYTIYTKQTAALANQDRVITQIIDTIHLIHVNPNEEKHRIASVSKTNDLDVSITQKPVWKARVKQGEVWKLNNFLQQEGSHSTISIELLDGNWINFHFHPGNKALTIQISIIVLETLMAVMLLLFAWYIERFTGPLREFKKAAEKLGIELHSNPIIEYGPPIVKETANAMNRMQKRIIDLIHDRTRMLAAISHDLRTPITRMKLRIKLMHEQHLADDMVSDLDEMEQLIDQILSFTRDAASQEAAVKLDLNALLMSLVDEKIDQGASVDYISPDKKIYFVAKPLALKRAIVNILNNALKYATHVEMFLSESEEGIEIAIEDNGPGIPEEELEKVFTPFYRVDKSRTCTSGGSGLGLAIAQDIVRAHKGIIRLMNRPQGGLRVEITFY